MDKFLHDSAIAAMEDASAIAALETENERFRNEIMALLQANERLQEQVEKHRAAFEAAAKVLSDEQAGYRRGLSAAANVAESLSIHWFELRDPVMDAALFRDICRKIRQDIRALMETPQEETS